MAKYEPVGTFETASPQTPTRQANSPHDSNTGGSGVKDFDEFSYDSEDDYDADGASEDDGLGFNEHGFSPNGFASNGNEFETIGQEKMDGQLKQGLKCCAWFSLALFLFLMGVQLGQYWKSGQTGRLPSFNVPTTVPTPNPTIQPPTTTHNSITSPTASSKPASTSSPHATLVTTSPHATPATTSPHATLATTSPHPEETTIQPTTLPPTKLPTTPPTTVATQQNPIQGDPTGASGDAGGDLVEDVFELSGITKEQVEFWSNENEKQGAWHKELIKRVPYKSIPDWGFLPIWDSEHESYCINRTKRERFATTPLFEPKTAQDEPDPAALLSLFDKNTLKSRIAKVEHTLKSLCEYYKPANEFCDLQAALKPSNKPDAPEREKKQWRDSLELHAWKFAYNIVHNKSLNIGILGYSVLSGQDNCFKNTYGPGLERDLNSLTGPLLPVVVMTSAQNGDGPPMFTQLSCTDSIFQEKHLDLLHFFWTMGPIMSGPSHEFLMRKWLSKNILLFYTTDTKGTKTSNYFGKGVLLRGKENEFPGVPGGVFPWWTGQKAHWGRIGDGRCHLKTRENVQAVYAQNWHPGPMGHQILRDSILFSYAQSYLLALKQIQKEINVNGQNSIRKLQKIWNKDVSSKIELDPVECKDCNDVSLDTQCLTGHGASWNGRYNISMWIIPDATNPYVKSVNDSEKGWKYGVVKGSSNMRGAKEKEKEQEEDDPDCNAHSDISYGYTSNGSPTSWLSIRIPKFPATKKSVKAILCTVRHLRKIQPAFSIKLEGETVQPTSIKMVGSQDCCIQVHQGELSGKVLSVQAAKGYALQSALFV